MKKGANLIIPLRVFSNELNYNNFINLLKNKTDLNIIKKLSIWYYGKFLFNYLLIFNLVKYHIDIIPNIVDKDTKNIIPPKSIS